MSKNYLSQMLYALTSPYIRTDYDNEKRGLDMETNIGKLFSILAYGLDSVDEQAELIRAWDDIDNARGKVLDRYGANWGVKRITPNDAIYRIAIKVKVLSQLSGGDIDTVIRAAGSLLDVDLSEILLEEVFPAKIALYVDWELLSQEHKDLIEPIAEAIKRILAAGVGLRLYVRTYHTSRLELSFSRIAFIDTDLTGELVGQDRESMSELWIGHGAFGDTLVQATPPDVEKPLRGSQSRAGGVVYHSHIKSKRIN